MIAGQIPSLTQGQSQESESGYTVLNGESVPMSDWKGKTVYLKFWATWCPVCLIGMNEFAEWAAGQNLSFPILLDESGLLNQKYAIQGYPTSIFLDGEQTVLDVHAGHMNNEQIREQLGLLAR